MDEQDRVAAFLDEHGLRSDPEYHVLDLSAEVGEIAADATKSTDWGDDPDALSVSTDEIGDALFALLAVAESLDVDAGAALDEAMAKYERRIDDTGDASSGE